MVSLEGQKVVIIGGSYGMGLATAGMAVDAGADVALAARGVAKLGEAFRSLQAPAGARQFPFFASLVRPELRAGARHALLAATTSCGSVLVP